MNPIILHIKPSVTKNTQPAASVQEVDPKYQSAEIAGIVTTIEFSQRRGDPTNFRIHCPNMAKTFNAVCHIFCPIRTGDTIYALCMLGPDGRLHINKSPFVQPAIDRESIIQCFMKATKQIYGAAVGMHNKIAKIAGGDDAVIPFLTGISQSWNDTRNTDILYMFHELEPDNIKNLLNWWHRERNLRRLYLFGLTKKEINACRMTCDEIYTRCIENPYTMPPIPLEKCDNIVDIANGMPSDDNKLRGSVIRLIWKNLNERGWTGTPTRHLSQNFPGIKDHVEALKEHYGMVAELQTAYLKFPHKVETFIADYLINMVRSDPIKYDTPVDQQIMLENGDYIERSSAHLTRNLSEDQRMAIQGALDHKLCIVTGGGGSGKCCSIGTQILMFDGSIKKVEHIMEGEYVMGPDSNPRKVLSTCTGIDDMFEVIPTEGRSHTFNAPHVLTLKGFEPYLGDGKKRHVAYFSEKGYKQKKSFPTEQEAQTFIDDLDDDIFDIPLNQFMLRSADLQQNSYLFHVGVDFPEKYTLIDPYIIGYWLGNEDPAQQHINIGDSKVPREFYRILERYDMTLKVTSMKYHIKDTDADYQRYNEFLNSIRDLDMLNNKHIPDIYKINSRENRLKLLAGLMDSSGYIYQGHIEIIHNNKRLSDDIEYLAFSLGFMVTKMTCECHEETSHTIYQRVTIFGGGLEEIPVILPRKRFLLREIKKRATCLRFEIKPIGKGIYCGFELDGDGRFLLGDFLVTHNTTCLGQIVHNLELRGVPYAVCSFMGKAVARIREVTGKRNPSTMHRLIANTRKNQFGKLSMRFDGDTPQVSYKKIIIDEGSTITTELLYDFIQAYPNIESIILIGDVNQLNPIGWGNLFQQMLKSETIPTYRLTTNYRVYNTNGERDGIILNANAIVSHDPQYPFEYVMTTNFSVIEGPIERVYDIIRGCYAGGVKAHQLVVVTPYNRSLYPLNREFQEIYSDGRRSVTDSRGVRWMIGDRVMLGENDQEINVFNGESGDILDITDKAILVDFGSSGSHEFLLEPTLQGQANYNQGTSSSYYRRGEQLDGDEGDIDEERTVKRLQHAFAITIDKSQGSEWDFVILYIDEFNTGSFVNRFRVYTAETRAKRCFWAVVSDIELFNIASVKPPPYRCDNLNQRLSSGLPNLKPFRLPPLFQELEMNGDYPILPEDMIPDDQADTGFDCDDL